MSDQLVTYACENDIAVLRMDDGKVNVLSHDMLDALNGALDRAEKEAKVLVLTGREEKFSAGFDLKTLASGPENAQKLLDKGSQLLLRIYGYPMPVIAGCTGHAIAAGALMLLAADARLGTNGEFKVGLNETAIKMYLPILAQEFARDRLDPRMLTRAALFGELFDPEFAVDAGYLDMSVDADEFPVVLASYAKKLASISGKHYAATKRSLRGATIKHIQDTLPADLDTLVSASG